MKIIQKVPKNEKFQNKFFFQKIFKTLEKNKKNTKKHFLSFLKVFLILKNQSKTLN